MNEKLTETSYRDVPIATEPCIPECGSAGPITHTKGCPNVGKWPPGMVKERPFESYGSAIHNAVMRHKRSDEGRRNGYVRTAMAEGDLPDEITFEGVTFNVSDFIAMCRDVLETHAKYE